MFFSKGPVVDLYGIEVDIPVDSGYPPKEKKHRAIHRALRRDRQEAFFKKAKELGIQYRDFQTKAGAEEALAKLQPHFDFPLKVFTYSYL